MTVKDTDAVALLIRQHWYDVEDETCGCIAENAASKADMLHLSVVEHSIHLSRLILALAFVVEAAVGENLHAGLTTFASEELRQELDRRLQLGREPLGAGIPTAHRWVTGWERADDKEVCPPIMPLQEWE